MHRPCRDGSDGRAGPGCRCCLARPPAAAARCIAVMTRETRAVFAALREAQTMRVPPAPVMTTAIIM